MKKNSNILFGLLAAALMTGCTASDELAYEATELPTGNSDVEIVLGAGSHRTSRASIDSDNSNSFAADGLGVFCLAKGKLGVNSSDLPISFVPGDDTYSVWMNNVEANAKKVVVDDTDPENIVTATNIEWANGETYYYPNGNGHKYAFYGYYPRQTSIEYSDDVIETDLTIDGTVDVLWGKDQATDADEWAYSARYFRVYENRDKLPTLKLDHKLMRLTFTIQPGGLPNETTELQDAALAASQAMGIKEVKLFDIATKGHMIIADKTTPAEDNHEGEVTFDWDNDLENFFLCHADGSLISTEDHLLTGKLLDEKTRVGDGFLIPVPPADAEEENGQRKLWIEVTLSDEDGTDYEPGPKIPIDLADGHVFEAGKSYNVALTIHGAKVISLKAELTPWEEDTETVKPIDAN